ncbi:ABC transporter substrate-binding protein, partial [Kitasatospora sp. NPDC093558]|uniref:ABC transporter substrate-binding protein n=1 Tax=Kitasatospora sp. NPDC093558 TaxID=3155201 RepID=UPI00342B2AB3
AVPLPEARARVVPPPPPVQRVAEFGSLAKDLVSPPPDSPQPPGASSPPGSPPPTGPGGPPGDTPPTRRTRRRPHSRRVRALVLGLLLVAVAAVATVVSISRSGPPPSHPAAGAVAKPGAVPAVSTVPSLAAMVPAAVRSSGRLVVATTAVYPPNEWQDKGTLYGWDLDLAKAIGQKLGLAVAIEDVPFDSIFSGVASSTYQLGMSSITDTGQRETTFDLVDYFTARTVVGVKNGNPAGVDPNDLCGVKVAVVSGTTQANTIKDSINPACVNDGKPPVPDDGDRLGSSADVVNAVMSGRDQAMLVDSPVIDYASTMKHGQVVNLGGAGGSAPSYGIVVAKNTGLTQAVQGAVQSLIDDGNYRQILTKWGVQAGAVGTATVNSPGTAG